LALNDHVDEGHDYEDWEDADPAHETSTEESVQLRWDNMVELLVNLDPPNPGDMSVSPWLWASATVKLTGGRDNLRVFARNLECWNGGPEPPEGCWALIGPDDDLADEYFGTFSPRPAWNPSPNAGWRFFVEGIAPGVAELTLEFQSGSFVASDTVKFTVVKIDADVDSDNTNGVAPYGPDAPAPSPPPTPPPSNAEDRIEERPGLPGVLVVLNNDDDDGDHFVDWADGFNWADGQDGRPNKSDDNQNPQENDFVEMRVTLDGPVDPAVAYVRITYPASDPAACTASGGPPPTTTQPASQTLEIGGHHTDFDDRLALPPTRRVRGRQIG
jgi:hypothetical protein